MEESEPGQRHRQARKWVRGGEGEGGAAGASCGKDAGTEPGGAREIGEGLCFTLLCGSGGFATFLGLEPTLVMEAESWKVLLALLLLLLMVLQPHGLWKNRILPDPSP